MCELNTDDTPTLFELGRRLPLAPRLAAQVEADRAAVAT